MRYFANPSTQDIRDSMAAGLLDCIVVPLQRNPMPPEHVPWCADSGCFGNLYVGDEKWWQWLVARPNRERCAFATAPDVVGDAAATLGRSAPWLPEIRELGIPAAYVAQNGQEALPVPWPDFDVLFLGGDTAWKLGEHARELAREARRRGKRVHMGRVNSLRRLRYAQAIGCDSADGTFLIYGPDINLRRVRGWLDVLTVQPPLFETGA